MLLTDVNVLVYAFRKDSSPDHDRYRVWIESMINADEAYGICDLVLSGFLRVVTHPKVFQHPSTLEQALAFIATVRDQGKAVQISPGPDHWRVFTRLCHQTQAKGNLVPDAYLAALAIESGCEWITTDRDFHRFTELQCRHPFDSPSTHHREE